MKQKEYAFSYTFGGRKWAVSVWAENQEEAKRKIRAQASAVYDGEIVASMRMPVRAVWIKKLFKGLAFWK